MIKTARQLKDLIRCDEIEASPAMEKLWAAYRKKFSYAADLSWKTVMDAIRSLYQLVGMK